MQKNAFISNKVSPNLLAPDLLQHPGARRHFRRQPTGDTKMMRRIAITVFILIAAGSGLAACGKVGDPYRPSEVPQKTNAD
jgi:hypothetical protein